MVRSGVVVASTRRSMSSGAKPAISIALEPASTARLLVEPPMRRSLMPVRSVIQASLVSRVRDSSSLVTTLSGMPMPQPVTRE